MRRNYILLLATLTTTLSSSAEKIALTEANREIYGYFNIENTFNGSYGFAELNTSYLTNPELLFDFPENDINPMYAGAGVDGILYGLTYQWNGSMNPSTPSEMVAYNIHTGRITRMGKWAAEDSYLKPQDMTYDATTGTMYVMAFDNMHSMLMTANLETGELTKVDDIKADISFVTLAANPAGELYTIGIDGVLYHLDKTTGVVTSIFDTGLSGFNFNQSMEFDPTTGNLLWAANAASVSIYEVEMMEIDLSDLNNPTISNLGTLGNGAVFTSLYVPGATSYDAPAAPAGFTITSVSDKIEAILSWTNPSTTFGNAQLSESELNGIVIFRDGKQLTVLTDAKPGEAMTYTDSDITEKGEYRYDIFAIGTGGEGMKATSFVYLGEDSPAAVASPLLEGVDAYTSAVISWEPVTTGLHNGNIDPASVRYTVYRRPDNKLIAENITETSVTDNSIRRTLSYYYDVVASNELGEAPETPTRSFILGPAFETPFVEEFDSDKEALNRWLLTDANGDYNTWMFNSTAGSTFFGDYETALEYLISPLSGGPYYDADEWIVSGPIKFESGKKYEIELAVRSVSTEYLEIGIGSSEIPEDMYILDCLEIEPTEITNEGGNVRPTYFVTELRTEGIEIGSVGLHLCTPMDDLHYSFFQICTATIRERDENGINTVTTPVLLTRFNNGSFEINGDFEKVEIFATSGAKMMESTTAITDLSSCPEGVYVAVITTKSGRSTVKFVK